MYPMAMPPQYEGSQQPIIHSSLYTTSLISPEYYAPAQISHANQTNFNQDRQYDTRPNISSFYVNPQLTESNFGLHRNCITRGNYNNGLPLHSNVLNSSTNYEPARDSHTVSLRHKHFYAGNKQTSINEELVHEMTKMHLGYIETEDSPDKMEQRQKLEDKILNFLSITPHRNKFAFPEVLEILENSISMSSRFNAHKTACAFDALAQYASNLISQPWRTEFRQLKLYSGFWVHQISNYLIGAHTILELMGYTAMYSKDDKNQFCNSNMPLRYLHNGVPDPDLISRLALDCMIAYCECQCLHRIKEGLDSFDFGFSEILEFRQRYIGDIDGTIRHLMYNLQLNIQLSKQAEAQRMKQISSSPPPLPSRCSSHGPPVKSPSALSSNKHFTMPSNQDKYRTADGCAESFKSYKNQTKNCSKYISNYRSEHCDTENASSVPTARLIDLDSSIDGSSRTRRLLPKVVNNKKWTKSQDFEEGDNRSPASCQQLSPDVLKSATLEEHMKASLDLMLNDRNNSRQGKQVLESWDFVYKNLEKKGYSKDIGDRGDILNDFKQNSFPGEATCSKTYGCLNNKKYEDRPLSINSGLQKMSLNENRDNVDAVCQSNKSSGFDKHGTSKRLSLYDNVSTKDSPVEEEHHRKSVMKRINNAFRESKNEVREHKGQQSDSWEYVERPKRSRHDDVPSNRLGESSSWPCAACTYLNGSAESACQMCGKSKLFSLEDVTLESGSKECSNCTLINQKGAKVCSVCHSSLKACSTYI